MKSITVLSALLKKFASDPSSFDFNDPLRHALGTQGSLAKFENTDLGIRAMSLNTQKILATIALGSYEQLDNARLAAADATLHENGKKAKSSSRTKVGLLRKSREQEELLRQLDADLGYMTHAIARLTAYGKSLVDEIGTTEAKVRWRKELTAIYAGMSLSSCRSHVNNVTDIRHGRAKK